jgi:hypothetical protein
LSTIIRRHRGRLPQLITQRRGIFSYELLRHERGSHVGRPPAGVVPQGRKWFLRRYPRPWAGRAPRAKDDVVKALRDLG